jgi:hypothetical protein
VSRNEKPQKQKLEKMFKSNFQTMNKAKLCDLGIKNNNYE